MREKKRVLKFKKFKIANLNSRFIIGGGETDTETDTDTDDTSKVTTCTRTGPRTSPKRPCSDGCLNQLGVTEQLICIGQMP